DYGMRPLSFFLVVIVYSFKYIGRARRAAARSSMDERYLWALGAAIFANVVAFWGISYFDQTIVAWYALLAMIPAAATAVTKKKPAQSTTQTGNPPAVE